MQADDPAIVEMAIEVCDVFERRGAATGPALMALARVVGSIIANAAPERRAEMRRTVGEWIDIQIEVLNA